MKSYFKRENMYFSYFSGNYIENLAQIFQLKLIEKFTLKVTFLQ